MCVSRTQHAPDCAGPPPPPPYMGPGACCAYWGAGCPYAGCAYAAPYAGCTYGSAASAGAGCTSPMYAAYLNNTLSCFNLKGVCSVNLLLLHLWCCFSRRSRRQSMRFGPECIDLVIRTHVVQGSRNSHGWCAKMRHRLVLLRIVLGRSLLVRVIVWLLVLRGHVLLRCMVMHRCAVPIATPFASIATPFASIVTPFASIATVPLWFWVSAVCTDRRAVDGMLQSTHEVSCVEPKQMMLPLDTELASDT